MGTLNQLKSDQNHKAGKCDTNNYFLPASPPSDRGVRQTKLLPGPGPPHLWLVRVVREDLVPGQAGHREGGGVEGDGGDGGPGPGAGGGRGDDHCLELGPTAQTIMLADTPRGEIIKCPNQTW